MNVTNVINEFRKKHYKMCIYGMGKIGISFYEKIIEVYDLNIDFFSAANIDNIDIGKKVKIKKNDLLKMNEGVLIFLLVGKTKEAEIIKEFIGKENFKIITFNQILKDELFIRKFYDINRGKRNKTVNNKIAVFTCITNGYDDIKEPAYIDKDAEYFIISENPPTPASIYQWIDVKKVVPEYITDYKDQNRYCKMHGAEIFKEYRYSIYLDGSVLIKGPITDFINQISDCGLALFPHPKRESIFEEGITLCWLGYDKQGITNQLHRYMEEGIPLVTGLFACGIIARDNKNSIATKIMHEWFYEYMNGVKRDQLSFTYVLWKNGIDYSSIGKLGNILDSTEIEWLMTHG